MQDRIPTYPGLVELTDPETGTSKLYYMAMADNPTVAGTPLNKNTLLKDSTAALFGLTSSAVPDDVLVAISSGKAQTEIGSYTGNGQYGSGHKNSLTFGIVPKLVIICDGDPYSHPGYGYHPWVSGQTSVPTATYVSGGSTYTAAATCAWNDKTVEWYSSMSALSQLNANGVKYYYVAIG